MCVSGYLQLSICYLQKIMELRFTFWPLFLLFVSDAIAAVSTVSTNDCLPRCCAQGQIIDRTGTRCLINRSQGSFSDPCGRRDSFLPKCQEQGKMPRKIFPCNCTQSLFRKKLHSHHLILYYLAT